VIGVNGMRITRLYEDAVLPTRKNPTDAGLDLYAYGSWIVSPNHSEIVSTGIAIEIPLGYFGLLKPKSRSDYLVGAGVVDQNYRGEILVKVVNYKTINLFINKGTAIAQLLIIPIFIPDLEEVDSDEFDFKTDRGIDGGIARQLKTATFISKIGDN
jgi:dUTP pyrophosphatase